MLSAITSNTSDQIFFLDIEIKGEDKKGLDIAKIIRQNNPYAIIAFVTTHIEFMPQAFGVTAYKYINKTLDEASFRKEIGETIAQVFPINATTTDEFFLYKTETQLINLPMDQILHQISNTMFTSRLSIPSWISEQIWQTLKRYTKSSTHAIGPISSIQI